METSSSIGVSPLRKDSWDKVTGAAKYNNDRIIPGILHAKLVTSTCAHALIKDVDISKAINMTGVSAIITGEYLPVLTGSSMEDRPPLAKDKIRYYGEPVAMVIASSLANAMKAANRVKVKYKPLPIVNSIEDSIKINAPLIHEGLGKYYCPDKTLNPRPNTNILDQVKIRKGDMARAWDESDVIVESNYFIPQSDHTAMEVRNAKAQISPDGKVIIDTSSQAPFAVREELSKVFSIPEESIIVRVPLVGGAFGGKATVDLEFLAYLASRAVGGRPVSIANFREEDIATSPCKIASKAYIKIGATKEGEIKALQCTYYVDCGAYASTGPGMAKAIAGDCSGPYRIKNIHCDSFSVYTNHCYVVSFRGFGHTSYAFAMERTIDKLAGALGMDPLNLRIKNAISEGDTSPTQAKVTLSNAGDLTACLTKLRDMMNWQEGNRIVTGDGKIRAKGISCFWKTSNSPTNATSGVIITVNSDGSININFGAPEFGPGMKTAIAQIVAEELKMDVSNVGVFMGVDTQLSPKHWKTVASMTTIMAGNAAVKAARDLIEQLKSLGSIVMRCTPEDLAVEGEKVYMRSDPDMFVSLKDLVDGYEYPSGESVAGQMIARGNYIMRHLVPLDGETGRGKTGVSWTVGAQGVEIEYDPGRFTYRLINAASVFDVGKVINPKIAKGLLMGGMNMGLGLATREEFQYDDEGKLENTSLRTYKPMHLGENPKYSVGFIENPQVDTPFGARGLAEHGVIGMPSAFANALTTAVGMDFNQIPISPELIWKTETGGKYDTI